MISAITRTKVLSVILMLLYSLTALPAEMKLKILTSHTCPYGYIDETGNNSGVFYELGNIIAAYSDMEYENSVVPNNRIIKSLVNGGADMAIMTSNDVLDEKAYQLAPILKVKNVIIVHKDNDIMAPADLKGKKIAVSRGINLESSRIRLLDIERVNTSTYEQSLEMLLSGRVDGIAGSKISIESALKKFDERKDNFYAPITLNEQFIWLHFSKKGDTEKLLKLLQAMKIIVEYNLVNIFIENDKKNLSKCHTKTSGN